jgi:hypothetical protein
VERSSNSPSRNFSFVEVEATIWGSVDRPLSVHDYDIPAVVDHPSKTLSLTQT